MNDVKPFLNTFFRAAAIAAVCLLVVGCSDDPPAERDSNITRPPLPTTGPYVSVAVDDHFHDIHVEDDIRISGDRPFVVKNQGRNLHNVTILGTEIDVDIRPGKEWSLDPLEDSLEPATYSIICKYHAFKDMVGQITVTE